MLTNSPPHGLFGRQEPRVRTLPPSRVGSRIEDFRDITDLAGLTNDPWQDGALEAIGSVDADGQWAAREFGLLWELMTPPGRVLSKGDLSSRLSDGSEVVGENALEESFSRLRRKIAGSGAAIRTLRGLGYVLEDDVGQP